MKKVKCKIANKNISEAWVTFDDTGGIQEFKIIKPIECVDIEIIEKMDDGSEGHNLTLGNSYPKCGRNFNTKQDYKSSIGECFLSSICAADFSITTPNGKQIELATFATADMCENCPPYDEYFNCPIWNTSIK